ncbi:Aspartyl aminopeptidase [Actinidia chinensis var. chinensis]|uniref:Aspartyl aminopeptidase n=1 Tax=Actinidia chinensis var. chinensis TaxID=1590841 RepID=A0A2R6PED8_ACTCC|nr:Aspartyl aminopeptidase [Actinidia chinensis var. chinensis]
MAKESEGSSVAVDLIDFLNASPTAFHAVDEAKKRLRSAGYEQVSEREDWKLEAGKKYFFTRNHSTIVAFAIGKKYVTGNGFHVIGAHTDSPCLKLKPVSKAELNKVVSDNVPVESGYSVDGKKSNENQKHHSLLLQLLADEVGCQPYDICDFELQACDTQPSIIAGATKEFIYSGRLDNLCMSFCSLKALIDATSSESSLAEETGVRMVALFDHEEVGSNSAQGAGSPVMLDALSRITSSFSSEFKLLEKAIQKSFIVSADMAHALHPNYMDRHEDNHQPKLHGGLVIKNNANQRYATNAVTSFIFREIANKHNLPIQDFVVRNDMACGSTIGPILASGTGIRTVDVGAPQLSMHSIREMCAIDDVKHSYKHFKAFFQEFSHLDAKITVDI